MPRRRRASPVPFLLVILLCCGIVSLSAWGYSSFQNQVISSLGSPAEGLSFVQQTLYAIRLAAKIDTLTTPAGADAKTVFQVTTGEPVGSIISRLESQGFIFDGQAFRDYLIYKGYDTRLQPGGYWLSHGFTPIQIAQTLQDETARLLDFNVLPGWRLEEIAASLPTSGLSVSPDGFLAASYTSQPGTLDLIGFPEQATLEGFLLPGAYVFNRATTVDEMLTTILAQFDEHVGEDPQILAGFESAGLSVYQGITLASIVQRESVVEDEQPIIASVFLNRLAAGIKLESDPTVQYALGSLDSPSGWWKNPLSSDDLRVDSPYNTYLYPGLPPGPIANPGLSAIRAVAFPAQSSYFFFRARCDGSGRHAFAVTYDEHLQNACP